MQEQPTKLTAEQKMTVIEWTLKALTASSIVWAIAWGQAQIYG
ncbi:hypothetical protein [Pseudovibrio sp. Ad37]|nr:hypothetical protein [Pseudovibrio sp. Ad37]KZL13604.1 hypothetical protein PsAD37_05361 [Pseudovibrio sp. Ad37]